MKLLKSAEGLKQSGNNWLREVTKILKDLQFETCKQDPKLFRLKTESDEVLVVVQIDDFYGTAYLDSTVEWLYEELDGRSPAKLKNLGELRNGYGIEFQWNWNRTERSLSQQAYLEAIFVRF